MKKDGIMESRSYTVEPQSSKWPQLFQEQKKILQSVFGDEVVRIEHVGSTAVPGLAGKPTLDILIIVKDIARVDSFNDAMIALGFDALGEYVAAGGRLFKKDEDSTRVVNVHVFGDGHEKIFEMLAMRDYLKEHLDEVRHYSKLKQDLYRKFPADYKAYRAGKDPYLQDLKRKALLWYKKQNYAP